MNKHIIKDGKVTEDIKAVPVCMVDFCDSCGECLYCYWEDKCYGNDDGEHLWVKYED